MEALATAVLHHRAAPPPRRAHYDWLIRPPACWGDTGSGDIGPGRSGCPADRPLTTWRLDVHPAQWAEAGRVLLEALPDHRPAWLRRSGPVSGGRGWAVRVDRGVAHAGLWTPHRRLLTLRLAHGGALRADLRRIGPDRWACVFTRAPAEGFDLTGL
ncbi:MAG: hypothetical protein AAGA57_07260 [Planctomycetota bacterium]